MTTQTTDLPQESTKHPHFEILYSENEITEFSYLVTVFVVPHCVLFVTNMRSAHCVNQETHATLTGKIYVIKFLSSLSECVLLVLECPKDAVATRQNILYI